MAGACAAVMYGHLHIAKFLRAEAETRASKEEEQPSRSLFSSKKMIEGAKNGHLDAVQWLYEEYGGNPEVDSFKPPGGSNRKSRFSHKWPGEVDDTVAMDAAARFGHLEVVQYLHDLHKSMDVGDRKRTRDGFRSLTSPKCTKAAMDAAAANGHLNVVKWLHENRDEGCSTAAMDGAAANGHIGIVQWLHQNMTASCTKAAMDNAAMNGHLDIVKWLHINQCEGCTIAAMDNAAMNGHLEVVKYLHSNRNEGCTTEAMDKAAMNGHLRVVQWLQAHRTEGCTSADIVEVAYCAKLEVLLFLHLHYPEMFTVEAARVTYECGLMTG